MTQLLTNVAAGTASTLARGYSENFSPAAKTRQQEEREERRLRAEQRNAALRELQQQEDLADETQEVRGQEIELLRQQNNQAMADNARQTSYSAFDRYTADGDARHLNALLKDLRRNPQGQNLFGDVSRVDNITEADRQGMRAQGLDPDLILGSPELSKGIVKATAADGTVTYEDLTEIYKMSGYTRYASGRELEREREVAEVLSLYQNNGLRTETERQAHRLAIQAGHEEGSPEYRAAFNAEYERLNERETTSVGTKNEREAQRIVEAEGLSPGDEGYEDRYNQVYENIVERERQTTPSRQMDEVEQTKERIQEIASADNTDFFELDFSERSNRLKYENHIQRIERLGELGLTNEQKRDVGYIKQLLAVANPTGELSEQETGLIDRFSRGVRNYLSDNIEGLDSTSAYAAYRNTVRHALYGSALTDAEIKAFNEQFGTLGQQTGPVLAQFKTALSQTKAKLESISNLGDTYVSYYRLGMDQQELDSVIDALDERIEFFERAQREDNVPTGRGESVSPDREEQLRQLDELYGDTE